MAALRAARPGESRTRPTARAIAVAIALAVGRPAFAAPAAPAPEGKAFELSWDAPDECASAESVRQDVDRVVGDTGVVHRKLRAHGELRKTGAGGWSVTLTLITDTGRSVRTLTAPTCRAVARAAAVVIAFAMTADESDEAPAEEAKTTRPDAVPSMDPPAGPGPTSKARPLPRKTPVPTVKGASPAARLGPTVGVFARVDVGTLPKVGFGGGALVGWYARPVFLEMTFGSLVGQDREIEPPPQQSATISHAKFSAFFARTAVCPAYPGLSFVGGEVRVFGCTGFGVLQTRATGHPVAGPSGGRAASSPEPGTTIEGWSGSVFFGPRLRFARGWFALSASADIAAPFRRQEFLLTGSRGGGATVHRTSPVLLGMSLTVELSFSH